MNAEPIAGMEVFPNPFTNELIINLKNEDNSINRIELTDISGKIIFEKNVDQGNSLHLQLNKGSVNTPGFYLLRVITDNRTYTDKVLKR